MLKDYTSIKCKNCSTKTFWTWDSALHNSKVAISWIPESTPKCLKSDKTVHSVAQWFDCQCTPHNWMGIGHLRHYSTISSFKYLGIRKWKLLNNDEDPRHFGVLASEGWWEASQPLPKVTRSYYWSETKLEDPQVSWVTSLSVHVNFGTKRWTISVHDDFGTYKINFGTRDFCSTVSVHPCQFRYMNSNVHEC